MVEHRLQHRRCRCGTVTMAAVPDVVGAPAQYGPRVRAIGGYLVGYQHLRYERACETLADLLGAGMSVGHPRGSITDRCTSFTRWPARR